MIARIKEVYAAHHWPKLAASLALLLAGILLVRLEGGFPPGAWLFLFRVLPQLPTLWAQHGAATLLPLFGLIIFSLTLLIVWVLIVALELSIFRNWWLTLHARPLAPARGSDQFDWQPNYPQDLYDENDADNFADLDALEDQNMREEEFEAPSRPTPRTNPRQPTPQANEYVRRRESHPLMSTRPDPITRPEPGEISSGTRALDQTQLAYQPQSLLRPETRKQPPASSGSAPLTRPQTQAQQTSNPPTAKRPIALPPTNYASRPMPVAPTSPESKPSHPGRNGSRPTAPGTHGAPATKPAGYSSKPPTSSLKSAQPTASTRDYAPTEIKGPPPPVVERNASRPPIAPQNGVQPLVADGNETQPLPPDASESTVFDPDKTLPLPNKRPAEIQPKPAPAQNPPDRQTPPSLAAAHAPQPLAMPRTAKREAPGKRDTGKPRTARLVPAGQKAPDTDQLLPGQAKIQLVSGSKLDPGRARKGKPNEDNLVCFQGMHATPNGIQAFGLFVVADGMGGHANGQEASHIAINEVSNAVFASLLQQEGHFEAYATLLTESIQQANHQIFLHNKNKEELMGTTITAALVIGMDAYIANVGDSRTYLYRTSGGLRQITRDHSIVARFVELGTIAPDEVYSHPLRNQIYRCLGENATVQIDAFTTKLQNGDKLLLCSDGLWEMVQNQGIQRIFAQSGSNPNQICEDFIQAALDGGGDDNISAIVVAVQQIGDAQPDPQPSQLKTKVWPLEEGMDAI